MTDLTRGSAIKQIFLFSIPFLIGNLFQQLYNIADMVIVGRTLDATAYAAVGSTGSIVWFASGAIQALTVGFSVIAAQHIGSGDGERVKQAFGNSIVLAALISAVMSVVLALCARPLLSLLQTPPDIIDRAYRYVVWVFAGLAATALFNLLSNMIRSLGDSKTPLYFLIIACVLNIILDVVFIVCCGMDTDGAGLATVLAQLLSGLLCIVYIVRRQPLLHIGGRHLRISGDMCRRLLYVGVPMAFLNMVISVGGIVMQFVTNGLGTLYVTSQTTGAKLENFVTLPILSFGSAVAVFAAQNYGAKRYDRVIEGSKKTVLLGFAWSVIAFLIMVPFGRYFVSWMAGDVDAAIIGNAYHYIVLNTMMVLVLVPLVIYKSVLQAVSRTMWTMVSGFTEILGRAGVSCLVLLLINHYHALDTASGFLVMCMANPIAWLFGLLTILFDYIAMRRQFARLAKQQATI